MTHLQGMTRAASAATIASLLAACGGGGGDSASPPVQRLAITTSNASPAAAEAIDAGDAGTGPSGSVIGVQVSAPSSSVSAMATLASRVRAGLKASAPGGVVGVTASSTAACTGGGTVTTTVTAANSQAASVGDRIDLAFNACVEDGASISGGLSITLVSFNAGATSITADASVSSFTVTVGALAARLNGSMRMSLDESSGTHRLTSVTSPSISFDRLVNGTTRATRTLSNYSFTEDETLADGSTSTTFAYSVSGTFPRFGTVAFDAQTTQAIVVPGGSQFPTAGAGKVTGANGSSVAITVIAGGVKLDVDTDGNGTVDATITRTWAELSGDL